MNRKLNIDGWLVFAIWVAVLVFVVFSACVAHGAPLRAAWRPTLTGSVDQSTIAHGQTVHITYSSPDATGCAYGITQWGQWIGWADGVSIPTSGTLQITPALPGTFVVTIAAAKRRFNLNHDLATVEGHRRSVTLSFPITVTEPGKPQDAWDGNSPFQARLWFDPPQIKAGEATTRHWESSGATAYLDGQRVPANGSDVLRPTESIESVLQVTAGRRWKWVNVQRASVVVANQKRK